MSKANNMYIGKYITVENFLSIGNNGYMSPEAFAEARTIVTRLKYHCTSQKPPESLHLLFQRFEDKEGYVWYFFPNRTAMAEDKADEWYQQRTDVYIYACKILVSLLGKYKESIACDIFSQIIKNQDIAPYPWVYKPYIPLDM